MVYLIFGMVYLVSGMVYLSRMVKSFYWICKLGAGRKSRSNRILVAKAITTSSLLVHLNLASHIYQRYADSFTNFIDFFKNILMFSPKTIYWFYEKYIDNDFFKQKLILSKYIRNQVFKILWTVLLSCPVLRRVIFRVSIPLSDICSF